MELSIDSIAPSTRSQKGGRSEGSGSSVSAKGVICASKLRRSFAGKKVANVERVHLLLGLGVCEVGGGGGSWVACRCAFRSSNARVSARLCNSDSFIVGIMPLRAFSHA